MILPTPRVALSSCQVVKTGSDRQHKRSVFDDLMTLKQSISRITSRAAELHITMGRSNKKRKILLCMSTCLASSFKQMNHFIQIEDLNVLLCVMTENMTTDIQSFVQKLQAFGCCCIQMDPDIDGTNPRSSYCARITVNQDFGAEFVSYALNLDGVSPSS